VDGADGSLSRSRVLLGDPERERLTAILRDHYAEGRLTMEELRRRAEIVLAARYQDEADQALAELPAAGPGSPPAAQPLVVPSWPRRIDAARPRLAADRRAVPRPVVRTGHARLG
jgi:DUF1707 SHOCT-like domain